MKSSIVLRGVSRTFPNGVTAISGIDLIVEPGERLAIVGPSGSGKSTLLRVVAGLEAPDTGEVWIGGRRVDRLPPADRDVAMVFQQPAAYPHLSVFDNLAFGLRARRVERAERRRRVEEVAERLGLADLLGRRPSELSGGQRQRLAIGRAVVRRPAVLLLDEPFSELDAPLRAALRADLAELQRRDAITSVHVTHDQAEAMALGDRVAVLIDGRLAQVGTPPEVYHRPNSTRVAAFIGDPAMNLLPCEVEPESGRVRIRASGLVLEGGRGQPAPIQSGGDRGGRVVLGLRPEHLSLVRAPAGDTTGATAEAVAAVERIEPLGHEAIVYLRLGADSVCARLDAETTGTIRAGERLTLRLDLRRASWFEEDGGARIDRQTCSDGMRMPESGSIS